MRSFQLRSIWFLCIAVALLALALTDRFFGAILWPSLRGVFLIISVVGLAVLIVVPLASRRLGFYRSDSLKKVDEVMAQEESESDRRI
jgi:hypothetical protein